MPRIEPIPLEALPLKERQRMEHTIKHGGSPADKAAGRILAYSLHDHVPDDGDRHYNYPKHLLGGKLLEMLRIRSAQLGGCEPCMTARKVDTVTDEVVACLINPSLRGDLTVRERLALQFLELLAEVFTTAEIVELGLTCGHMIGTHRFIHTLDPYGDSKPVIRYDPTQVGVTWSELHDGDLKKQSA
jgi:hypothetical protein